MPELMTLAEMMIAGQQPRRQSWFKTFTEWGWPLAPAPLRFQPRRRADHEL